MSVNRLGLVFIVSAAFGVPNPTQAELSPTWKLCVGGEGISIDRQIEGCTVVINSGKESGRDLALAYNDRGTAYAKKKDVARAIEDYDHAIELEPGLSTAFKNRGSAYDERGEYERAIQDYDRAIQLKPTDPDAFVLRGFAYAGLENYDRAIEDYDKALELDPNHALAFLDRGYAYGEKRDLEAALSDLDRYVNLVPSDPDGYGARCWAQATLDGNLDDALADCNRSLQLKVEGTTSEYRGLVYLKLRRFNDALVDFDIALKHDPESALSLFGRGVAKLRSGDRAGGDADIAAAKSIDPKIANIFAMYGVTG